MTGRKKHLFKFQMNLMFQTRRVLTSIPTSFTFIANRKSSLRLKWTDMWNKISFYTEKPFSGTIWEAEFYLEYIRTVVLNQLDASRFRDRKYFWNFKISKVHH